MKSSHSGSNLTKAKLKQKAKRLYSEGASHFEQERYKLALDVFQRLRSEYAEVTYAPEIAMWLGVCHYWLGEPHEAMADLRVALNGIDKDTEGFYSIQIQYYLGRVHYALLDYRGALACLDEAEPHYHLWSEPESWIRRCEFRLLKGRVYLYLGLVSDCLRELTDARAQVPDSNLDAELGNLFDYELGRAFHYLGDQVEAGLLLGRVDTSNLHDSDCVVGFHHTMMRMAVTLADYTLALRHWHRLIEIGIPDAYVADVYSLAGRAHYHKGRGRQALECFKRSMGSPFLREDLRAGNQAYLSKLAKAGYRP